MYNYGYDYGYETEAASGVFGGILASMGIILLISAAIGIVTLISQWKIYKKAGKNGWECLIPIYNIIVLLQIVELPMWYIALFFVPFANIYAMIKIYIELAHKFGKSTGFGVLTAFFSFVCLPILAFSKDVVYQGSNNMNNVQPTQGYNPNMLNFQNENNMEMNNQMNPGNMMFNQNMNNQMNNIQQPFPNNQINNQVNLVEQPQVNQVITPEPAPFVNPQPQNVQYVEPTPVTIPQPVENIMPNNQVMEQNIMTNNFSNPVNPLPQPTPVESYPEQNPQPMNPQPQINVIPNMGVTPQPVMQNPNDVNNQNNKNM